MFTHWSVGLINSLADQTYLWLGENAKEKFLILTISDPRWLGSELLSDDQITSEEYDELVDAADNRLRLRMMFDPVFCAVTVDPTKDPKIIKSHRVVSESFYYNRTGYREFVAQEL